VKKTKNLKSQISNFKLGIDPTPTARRLAIGLG